MPEASYASANTRRTFDVWVQDKDKSCLAFKLPLKVDKAGIRFQPWTRFFLLIEAPEGYRASLNQME
jgi:hypothetical protein